MPTSPASFDTSTLFATEHGTVEWSADGSLLVALGRLELRLMPSEVESLHEVARSLAGDVYRCGRDCRWQLRVPGRSVFVLDSDEVLRLDTLLQGAVAMLELDAILDDAAVDWAEQIEDGR
jgi:hypothetical protein